MCILQPNLAKSSQYLWKLHYWLASPEGIQSQMATSFWNLSKIVKKNQLKKCHLKVSNQNWSPNLMKILILYQNLEIFFRKMGIFCQIIRVLFFFHFLANFRTSKKTTAHNVAICFPKKVFHMSCTGFSFACQDANIHPKFFFNFFLKTDKINIKKTRNAGWCVFFQCFVMYIAKLAIIRKKVQPIWLFTRYESKSMKDTFIYSWLPYGNPV